METGYGEDRLNRMMRERVQARWMSAYAPVRHLDLVLVAIALTLSGIGLVMIYSARLDALTQQGLPTMTYVSRQSLALLVGLVVMAVTAIVDYRHLRGFALVVYLAAVVLLVVTLTPLGTAIGGAQRWIVIGGLQLQPSELAKPALLIGLAALLHERKDDTQWLTMAVALPLTVVPMGLVFLQPDLGTSIVFAWLLTILLLVGGMKARYIIGLLIAGFVGVIAALQRGLIEDYQITRLTSFLEASNPTIAQGAGFQTRQSMIAIGSGQVFGKGLFEGTQTSLAYVPENHTDFIFTVVGEEFGFLGTSVVLALFLVLIWRGLRVAVLAKDLFGTLLAAGVVAMLALQVFVNVGMTIGIMPVTGIPLPFLSYGNNSLVVWLAMIGLLLNVHMRRF